MSAPRHKRKYVLLTAAERPPTQDWVEELLGRWRVPEPHRPALAAHYHALLSTPRYWAMVVGEGEQRTGYAQVGATVYRVRGLSVAFVPAWASAHMGPSAPDQWPAWETQFDAQLARQGARVGLHGWPLSPFTQAFRSAVHMEVGDQWAGWRRHAEALVGGACPVSAQDELVHLRVRRRKESYAAATVLKHVRAWLNPEALRAAWGQRVPDVRLLAWLQEEASEMPQRIAALRAHPQLLPLALLGNGIQGGLLPGQELPRSRRGSIGLSAFNQALCQGGSAWSHVLLAAINRTSSSSKTEQCENGTPRNGYEAWTVAEIEALRQWPVARSESFARHLAVGLRQRLRSAESLPPRQRPSTAQAWHVMSQLVRRWTSGAPMAHWASSLASMPSSWQDPLWLQACTALRRLDGLQVSMGERRAWMRASPLWLEYWPLRPLTQWVNSAQVARLVAEDPMGKAGLLAQELRRCHPTLFAVWHAQVTQEGAWTV